jgi:hypothetical protein
LKDPNVAQPGQSSETATAPKPLLSFDEFAKALEPELQGLHELTRPTFALRAYELVREKVQLERLRERFEKQPSELRGSIRAHGKILTQIRKSIRAIDAAQNEAKVEDPEMLKNFDVMEARRLLMMAEADLVWVKDQFLPSVIHPELRKGQEKVTKLAMPMHSALPVGFGTAKVDYWFIGKIDQLLETICITAKLEAVKIGRDKIIHKIYQTAFSETREIDRIKNARLRMARKRNKK